MVFKLLNLPYCVRDLEPYISKETLEYHHDKHHRAYVNKLNNLIKGTSFENQSLEEIIMQSDGSIFNNAAQSWNHDFYWRCMSAKGSGGNLHSNDDLNSAINNNFGSLEKFKTTFTHVANNHFGSGWTWLVKDKNGKLEILNTVNAVNPMVDKKTPLLVCDLWEHAYYIDTRNDRLKYINNFWYIVNWNFVIENFNLYD
ncbi:superoxide dismutase [Coxiella endosymbiont of Amblyomma americanum]|uniref:superoxide dismutase n=1 Tax=Coxiella endosymbiont of Amblyomma americanum TaxID=325775 RepID=UPI00057EE11C|nr:superoxide dismutase [Coxiella endosymbiont of Amblyomma americanum]AJC50214.1 superoxide dismutase [Coxiella endosymbiont of Amblyomma americanum]AUJ58576.1 superoxide dismutase [Fe] [Coxiella-like endosymbiont of Amblyomma americanum]